MDLPYRGMVAMNVINGVEYNFWGNVDFPTNEAAKVARDSMARKLWNTYPDAKITRSILRNQLRPYVKFGQPDGRSGHVYLVVIRYRHPLT